MDNFFKRVRRSAPSMDWMVVCHISKPWQIICILNNYKIMSLIDRLFFGVKLPLNCIHKRYDKKNPASFK